MKRERIARTAALVLGLIAFGLSAGVRDLPLLVWIWPGCLLFAFRHLRGRKELLAASGLLAAVSLVKLIGFSEELPGSLIVGVTVFIETLLPLLLDRAMHESLRKRIGLCACLLMPLTFIALQSAEQAVLNITPVLAVSAADCLPLLQCASAIGAQGLSLFILCFGAAAAETAEALVNRERRALLPAGIAAGALAFLLIAGGVRLAGAAGSGEVIRAAMALTPMDPKVYTQVDTSDLAGDKAYLRLALEKAKIGGASLLVFGEEAFSMSNAEEKIFTDLAMAEAKEQGIALLLPMEVWSHGGKDGWSAENKELLIGADGSAAGEYVKSKLIPLIETGNYVKGDGDILFAQTDLGELKSVGISSVICFDADHALYVSRIAKETRLLLVPGWCWDGVDRYHTGVMRLRAAETGVPLVDPSIGSTSAVIDGYGRTVAKYPEAEILEKTAVMTDVALGKGGKTLYRVLAYPLCALIDAAAAVLLLFGIMIKRKE